MSPPRSSRPQHRLARCVVATACIAATVIVQPFSRSQVNADPATGPGAFSTTSTGPITAGTVPDGTCSARVTALGGAGASSAATAGGVTGGRGSSSANINATFAVLPQQAYSGSVGGGGAVSITGGVGGGGAGADAPSNHDGAGGGGRTVVAIAGTTLVVAGGGGGAGAAHNNTPAGNGGPGVFNLTGAGVVVGTNGSNGVDSPGTPGGGTGGQLAAGGVGGVHSADVARNGSAGGGILTGTGGAGGSELNYDGAGGGGAGYTGGGGGASTTSQSVTGAGGGGGSSFVAATSPVLAAPGPASVSGSAGVQPALGAAGANGSMNLDWVPCLYNLALTKTASVTSVNAGGKITWTIGVTNNGPDPMTRGDILTLTDTLPSGSNATSPSPSNVVRSIAVSGGTNTNMTSGAVTCTGVTTGASMPSSTDCSRAYAGATGTPGSPTGGTRGLNVGETLTITYDQYISNTAACGTITNTATVVDRPTLNTATATNYVGNTVTDTASGSVTIYCYDLAVTKTVSPTPSVVQGGTVTWTITVVNNGPGNMVGPDATAANPLIITDTFPNAGVGTPMLVSQTGSAGTCTFTSPTITCPGSLNSGQQHSLTFSQVVNAGAAVGSTISNTATVSDPRTGDSNDSSAASTQVVAAPRLVLQKTLNGQNRFSNTDQFVMSIAGTGGGTSTTAGSGSTITAGTGVVTVATGAPATTYTLNETMAGGSASTLGQYANSISCTNAFGGSSTVLPAGPGTSFMITPQPSDNITCTFTNTPRPAQVTIAKTTLGGIGTFNYAMTNLASASTSVTTTTAGTPTNSAAFGVTALSTAVQLTEAVPSGWRIISISCVDANSAVTGNTGTFGTLAGNVITIPAAFVEAGANIVCTFTNEKLARLVIQKTANGGPGTFGYITTGGLTPSTFSLSPNPPTIPTVNQTFVDLIPGSYSVTETPNALFQLTDLTCVAAITSAPGSTITTNVATRTVSTILVAGADYTCTYTNVRDAQLTVVKTAVGGDETFSFTTTGTGNPTDPTPSITTSSGVGSSSFVVPFPTGVLTRTVTITEDTAPAGWVLRDIKCTNVGGTTVGTVSLPSVTLTLTPADTVNCNFTNERLPRVVAIQKESIGTTGAFNFSGGTNGLPANLTLDTSGSNPASSGPFELQAFNTPTSITETIPPNYTLSSATCVDGSGTAVSTSLVGGTLTINASAVVGGANLTCRFVNTRQSAQVRVDKRWFGATLSDQVTISSTGGTNNPGLAAVANTPSETDAGTPVTVYAGETLTFNETFNVGAAANYTTALTCTGASDTNPNNGLTIAPADDGAGITCQYVNSQLPNAAKTGGSVTGPTAVGVYTVNYTVTIANPGTAGSYGALVDTASFASNIEVTGASWATSSTSGVPPSAGSATGAGPFTLAPAGQAIAANAMHTFDVAVTFRFTTYTAASACAGPGTGLHNAITLSTSELQTTDNDTCIAPPAPPAPSIQIDKTSTPTTATTAGQTINYSLAVTNTGNVNLTSVSVSDPLPGLGTISCPVSSLAPGGSTTCAASYTVTQADINAGAINNAASVIGTAPDNTNVTASDTNTVTATRTPSISLTKTANPTTVTTPGQIVTYSFLVSNTGNVTLTAVGVNDPLPGLSAVVCPVNTLAPGISTTCTATYTAAQADINAGTINNTATATGTPPAGAGAPVTATSSASVTATRTPSIDIDKTANPAMVATAGQAVTYSLLVTNTGNVTLTSVGVSDPLPGLGAITCPANSLAPGTSTTCTANYTATQADINAGAISNTATTTGTPPAGAGGPVTDTDPNTVTVSQTPAIDLQKTASPTVVTTAGQVVTYSFVVTNNGNVTLSGVSVVDPLPGLGTVTCPVTTLVPTASTTCAATYTVTQANIDSGEINNTATAQGFPPSGPIVTDTDSETVTATRAPSIDIVKTANPTTVTAAGQTVTYSFLVTNTGNVTLTSVGVSDPLPGLTSISCPVSTLAPAASTTCNASYLTTQADVDSGVINNTASTTGTPVGGGAPVTDTDSETVTATRAPSIDIVKTANPTTVTAAGQTVTYSFLVANTGNVTLTSVGVSDPLPGLTSISCPVSTLAPAASTTCTASYLTTQADVNAGAINNTASTTGTPVGGGAPVTDTDSETVTATRTPSIEIVKTANPNNVVAAGQTVDYSFLVTNTGNVTLTSVGVTDPLPGLGTITCPTSTLAPAASTTCTAGYVTTLTDINAGAINNTATTTGTPPVGAGGPVSDTDAETVTASAAPAIQIVKSASPSTVTAAGQSVTYSFVVTNTGNVTLSGIVVSDPLPGLGTITCPVTTLAPAAGTTCTASYLTTQADVNAGAINNTASVTGTPPSGPSVTDSDTETVVATRTPSIQIVKSASPTTITTVGQTVTYSFAVTNTGNVTLTGIGVFDPLPGLTGVACPATTLAPGAGTTCTASKVVTQADIDNATINNTATVSGTPPAGPAVTDTSAATVTATQNPSIDLAKSANPTTVTAAGQTVNYSFVVANTGNVTLAGVAVSDPLPGLTGVSCPTGTLAPGASTTCTASKQITQAEFDTGVVTNTATASGNPPTGPAVSDTDSATVNAPANTVVDLAKSASPNNVTAAGQLISYSFVVTNQGNVTLSGIVVSDPLPGMSSVTCPVSTLAPGSSTTCSATYTSTVADMNNGQIPNTATVAATPPIGTPVNDNSSMTVTATAAPAIQLVKSANPTTVSAAGQTVNYSFLVNNTGNVTLTGIAVTDPLPNLTAVVCPVTALAPGASTSCSATYTSTQADIDAGTIDNTAGVVGTPPTGPSVGDSDTETVTAARAPSIDLDKSANPSSVNIAGDTVTYNLLVTNTGNVTLTGITVTDPLPGLSAVDCPVNTLAPGASTTCTATYSFTQGDVDDGFVDNTAIVTGAPPPGAGGPVSDGDNETVTAPAAPSLTVLKTASPTTVTTAGQAITYTFGVTNTGNVTLLGIGVSDPMPGLGAISCLATTLAPTTSTTCTAIYVVTQADVDGGAINNTATASATPPGGIPVISDTDSETVLVQSNPSVTLVKSASPNNVIAAGQTVNYSFLVTNTGNVTLRSVGVSDPLPDLSAVNCPATVLAPGSSTTCTAGYVTTQADIDAGAINNTATASGTPPTGPAVSDTDAETVTATAAPGIQIVKSAIPTTVTATGQTVTYSFLVGNTGNVTVTGIVVGDPLPGLSTINCPVSSLTPGTSTTCTATYTATQADVDAGSINNTASVTGNPPTGPAVGDSDSVTVTAPASPNIDLVKTASPTTVTAADQTVSYSFLVTNTGNVTLTGVAVSDALPNLSAISCPVATLVPGASTTCTATYVTSQADIDLGQINNTATATGTPPFGAAVTHLESATVTAPATPSIDLVKTASPTTVTTVGQAVTYNFGVTNTGNVTLSSVGVSDPLPGLSAVTCLASTLTPSTSTTCNATYPVTQADLDAGAIENTAIASGRPPTGPAVTDTDIETVLVQSLPSMTLLKSASPNNVTAAGQTVTYSFLVTNTGNVTLGGVGVTDPLPGLSAINCPVTTLAPGADTMCTAGYVVTLADMNAGAINNTATAAGTPPTGLAVGATDSETVTAAAAPAIQIAKTANPTTVTTAGHIVNYSFLVTNTGNVTLTSVAVNDPLPGLTAIACPVTVLAPGSTTTCTAGYVTTQADIDAGRIDNTATAEGFPPVGPVVTDSDSETVTAPATPSIEVVKSASPTSVTAAGQTITYSFLATNIGNVTLTLVGVSDPLPGLSSIACPTTTLAPAASTTCTATYAASQADIDRGAINNTASVAATPPSGPQVGDVDSMTVTAARTPAISIVKAANPTTVTTAGQTISYSFLVTNTGNVTLTSVAVNDPLPGLSAVVCPVNSLTPNTSTTCTATYTATQADVDAGSINNTATVSATPPSGPAVTAIDTETVLAPTNPSIVLVKSASPNNVIAAGQMISYSFLVTNTGNVTLTGVGVSDPLPGLSGVTCPGTTLAPNASMNCTATYVVTQADMNAGAINNTATADGTPPTGPAVSDSDPETVTAANAPAIQIVKSASPATVAAAGQTVNYSFVVSNTGNVTLTGVVVSDPLPGLSTVSCPATILAPGSSTTCTAVYAVTQTNVDAGAINNTASVTATTPTGPAVTDTDSITVPATRTPSIDLVKSASPTTVTATGQTITYSFDVTNTGNVTLTGISVFDPRPGMTGIVCPSTTLAPGASTTCTATYVTTQADIDAGTVNNLATVSGTPPAGPAVTDSDTEIVTALAQPSITLVKTAMPTTLSTAGQAVNYTFVVTNTGNVTLSSVSVGDPLADLSAVSCPAATLAPGVSTNCTASYVTNQADIDAGGIVNTATASGTPPVGGPVTVSDTATVTAVSTPSIDIVKSASPNNVIAAGQTITYSFLVTNTGNVTLSSVVVTDPLAGLGPVTCPQTTLAPSAAMTCSAAYTASTADMNAGSITNTATVTGTPPTGPVVSDNDSEAVTAVAAPAIQVVKTANPTTITATGQVVDYTFLVTNTGNVTLTGIVVTDPLPGLGPVNCPSTTLAIGSSMACTSSYTATLADINAGGIDNTATATGNPPTGPTVNDTGTASVTATQTPTIDLVKSSTPTSVTTAGQAISYSFVVTNTGNVTLTSIAIADPLPGLSTVTCPATTLDPGVSTTCTATTSATQAEINAGAINNTATATGTPPTGPAITATDSDTISAPANPAISLIKAATPTTVTAAGQIITYTFTVANTGNVTLTGVGVSDPLPGLTALNCLTTTLQPGTSTTCTATYTVTLDDMNAGSVANTATAAGTSPAGPTVTDTDNETVTTSQSPAIDVQKSATPNNVNSVGQTITYTFVVANTGNVTLTGVTVSDPLPGLTAVNCPTTNLTPGTITTCTATRAVTQIDLDAGAITNTATATGTPPSGPAVTDTDTATVTAAATPAIQIVKSASPTTVAAVGQTIIYSFVVSNTGNVTLTGVVVNDPLPGLSSVACPVSSLTPGDSTTCTASYTVTQADLDAGVINNTASATGTPPSGPAVTDIDTETVTATPTQGIALSKSASPATVARAGDTVTYNFVVTNIGNATLNAVAVADPKPGLSAVSCPAGSIAPGAQFVCTATYVVTQADADAGTINNTATATGKPGAGTPIRANDSAVVTITAAPSVSLVKTATPATVGNVGDTVTFRFVSTNTGNVTLTGVVVTDQLPGLSAINCPGFNGTLAPGASVTCTATYSVTQTDMTAGTIRNTATVAANAGATGTTVTSTANVAVAVAQTPSLQLVKSVSAASVTTGTTVIYSFVVTNTGNVALTSVDITDPLVGLSAITCGGFDGRLDPGGSATCTATYVARLSAASDGRINNTAIATGRSPDGTLQTDQDTVVLAVIDTGGTLVTTGTDSRRTLTIAAAFCILGWGILATSRQRRRTT